MTELSRDLIRVALTRVGERLFAENAPCAIVIAGGAALALLEVITRVTSDVDVIAMPASSGSGQLEKPPQQLPAALERAVMAVGRELNLVPEWFDLRVAEEWQIGLPGGFQGRVEWREFGGALQVGIAGRQDLIYFKLVAAADGQHPRHLQDLRRLKPNDEELRGALHEARSRNVGLDADLAAVVRELADHD